MSQLASMRVGTEQLASSSLDLILEEFVSRIAERVAERLAESREISVSADRERDLLSVREAAAVLRCKPQRVYDLRSAGRLPRTTEGGRAVVRRFDLERLVAER